jgi:hypothetical protein
MSDQMKLYQKKVDLYYRTLNSVSDCGPRGQKYIDKAYEDMYMEYFKLSDYEKQQVTLPKKEISYNDGTNGIQTGIQTMSSEACFIQ